MLTTKVDRRLGLNDQAVIVLEILSRREITLPEGTFISTAAWYNGRECGFVVTFKSYVSKKSLHVVCVENRNSDNIVIYNWCGGLGDNPPTVRDFNDDAYRNGEFLGFGEYERAADRIVEILESEAKKLTF